MDGVQYVSARGMEFCCRIHGEGSTRVLLILGSNSDLRKQMTTALCEPLIKMKDVQLLTYDHRGQGRSSKPAGECSMKDFAEDAVAIAAAVGWTRYHIIGYSFGGMVAQEVALSNQERVEKLVLISSCAGGVGGLSLDLSELWDLNKYTVDQRLERTLCLDDTRRTPEWREHNPDVWRSLMWLGRADDAIGQEEGCEEGLCKLLGAWRRHDTWERLPSLRMPVLILGGKTDGICPPSCAQQLGRQVPHAELHICDGGHSFLLQSPGLYDTIIRFLKVSPVSAPANGKLAWLQDLHDDGGAKKEPTGGSPSANMQKALDAGSAYSIAQIAAQKKRWRKKRQSNKLSGGTRAVMGGGDLGLSSRKEVELIMEVAKDETVMQMFARFDMDHTGSITATELEKVMFLLGEAPVKGEVKDMISSLDLNGDGVVDYWEFCVSLYKRKQRTDTADTNHEMDEACQLFPTDAAGYVMAESIREILTQYGDGPLDETEVEQFFRDLGISSVDGVGKIHASQLRNMPCWR